jgi:hypothetical protein
MQQIVDEWRFEPHGVDHRHEETEKFCLLTGLKVNRNAPLSACYLSCQSGHSAVAMPTPLFFL